MSRVRRNKAQIESLGEGRFRISGLLDAGTVTLLLAESTGHFHGLPEVTIDFHNVSQSDSSGLALLLEWLRLARKAGQKIHFNEVPEQIMALARISEVDDLLIENGAEHPPEVVAAPEAAAVSG
ncbi:MAG TPA: STAS domain-containing protein [Povalibacter sp.]